MAQPEHSPRVDPRLIQAPADKLISSRSLEAEIEKLSRNDCVRPFVVGKTAGGRLIHLLAISSPENLADLDRHKEAAAIRRRMVRYRSLGDCQINDSETASRIKGSVPSVLIHCGAFAFEAAHTEAGIQLAELLVSGQLASAEEVLRNLIVLILPMVNPDGRDLALEQWKRFPLCAGFLGAGNGQGFYLNRDFNRLSQAETRAVHDVYNEWQPMVALDPHEDLCLLGVTYRDQVCWAPPFLKPHHPDVEASVLGFVDRFGTAIVEAWRKRGFAALHDEENGALLDMMGLDGRFDLHLDLHGTPAVITESARTPGVQTWEDRVEQKVIAATVFLECSLKWKEELLSNQHQLWLEHSRRGQTEPPVAIVIPRQRAEQADVALATELVELLHRHGIQIYLAEEPYPSWIVPLGQPDRAVIRAMLLAEPWNLYALPPAFGITSYALSSLPASLQEKFRRAPLEIFSPNKRLSAAKPSGPSSWLVDNNVVGVRLVNELLRLGKEVLWNIGSDFGEKEGSFTVPAPPPDFSLSRQASMVVQSTTPEDGKGVSLQSCRVALYGDQGVDERNRVFWADSSTGLTLMNFDFDPVTAQDIWEGKLVEYDALLIPGGDAEEILRGWRTDLMFNRAPWEAAGAPQGLGERGISCIREFIKRGGTYIGIAAGGAALATKEYAGLADVSIAAHTLGQARVLLRLAAHPLTSGTRFYRTQQGSLHRGIVPAAYYSEPILLTHGGPLFEVGKEAQSVADYEDVEHEPWTKALRGDASLFHKGLSAIVHQRMGKGRIILYGINPDFRATWLSTYRFLSNALFLAKAGSNLD